MTLLIVLLVFFAFNLGWTASWLVFDHKIHAPLVRRHKEAIKGWSSAIQLAIDILSSQKEQEKELEAGMILSPLQIKRPRKSKDED